jgi:phospholipase/carboxylesterase
MAEVEQEQRFGEAVGRLAPIVLAGVEALERLLRWLHPPDLPDRAEALRPLRDALIDRSPPLEACPPPEGLEAFREDLLEAAVLTQRAMERFLDPGREGASAALLGMHEHARAQARLYPLRRALPPIARWFAEPFRRDDLDSLEALPDSTARVGLMRSGEPDTRGGFDLYVPESYDGSEPWPLVVALHGGSGHGADFLWTWLREARSRRVLLLAPTSRGSTWSLDASESDGRVLCEIATRVSAEWNVDRDRVLLTGLSDGATMSFLVGLGDRVPFTHLAPISGVLHPMNFALGNLDRARDRPIYLVHGRLDWLFPVALAREAARVLEEAGAALVYREIADLSHTYPREENARIIAWLDPSRALGEAANGGDAPQVG